MFPCKFGMEIACHIAIPIRRHPGLRELADAQESIELRFEIGQFFFIRLKIAEAGDDGIDIHRLRGQHELSTKIIEALQVGERHRTGQQAMQHFFVEVEMTGVRHIAQILTSRRKRASALGLDEALELRRRARAHFPIFRWSQKIRAL